MKHRAGSSLRKSGQFGRHGSNKRDVARHSARIRCRCGIGVLLALAATGASADEMSELSDRVEAQERKIEALERALESRAPQADGAEEAGPVVKAGSKGFSIASPDDANQVKLRGTLHFDGRYFLDDAALDSADTWLLRRVRPTLEGTLNGIWDFRFTPDFSGGETTIVDAYAAVRLKPWAVLTAGKFKPPVGLERLISSNDLKFIERGLPTTLVPNRDLGVQLSGDLGGGITQYALGVFNGVIDGGSSDALGDTDVDGNLDWAARVFFQPFAASENSVLHGLGFGVAGTYADVAGNPEDPLLPSFRSPDQQRYFSFRGDDAATPAINEATYLDGKRKRIAPQAYYYIGSFGALGEYVRVTQDVSRNTAVGLRSDEIDTMAWQLELSYFLTGERAAYKGFTPIRTLDSGAGTWGAFEVVARYQEMKIDDLAFAGGASSYADPSTQPRKASAYTLGLNWYFNQNFKWQIDYEHVAFDGGARDDGAAILTRFAVGF